MPGQRPDDGVNVIGHDDPRAQFVTLANEEFQRSGNQICHLRPAQLTGAAPGIEQRFDLVTIPGEKALFFVLGERAFGGAGLFHDNAALVFEPGNFVSRQGIAKPKSDEISHVFFF